MVLGIIFKDGIRKQRIHTLNSVWVNLTGHLTVNCFQICFSSHLQV